MHGMGVQKCVIGTFRGAFIKNKRNGPGSCQFRHSLSYDGWWKDDQMWGHGKLSERTIEFYRGEFVKNQVMGEGRMFCLSWNR